MNWLEKHINLFFKINGILMLLIVIFGIWAILQLGIPHNSPSTWTPYQRHMVDFLWKPTLICSVINVLFAVLYFMRKYFIFLIVALISITSFPKSFSDMVEIVTNGLIYPVDNLLSIFWMIEFILSIIGTIIWIRKIRGKNMPVNG